MSQINTGQSLPRLTAESTAGTFDTSTLHGRYFVLYFYPKDNTPGCTTESRDFRDLHPEFLAAGCDIYGVSRDSLKSHQGFIEKQSLPFALVSDPDEKLCQFFGVMKLKNMYGKQVRGIERSTFLFDPEGKLVREWRKVRVPGHASEVLQAVQGLAS